MNSGLLEYARKPYQHDILKSDTSERGLMRAKPTWSVRSPVENLLLCGADKSQFARVLRLRLMLGARSHVRRLWEMDKSVPSPSKLGIKRDDRNAARFPRGLQVPCSCQPRARNMKRLTGSSQRCLDEACNIAQNAAWSRQGGWCFIGPGSEETWCDDRVWGPTQKTSRSTGPHCQRKNFSFPAIRSSDTHSHVGAQNGHLTQHEA